MRATLWLLCGDWAIFDFVEAELGDKTVWRLCGEREEEEEAVFVVEFNYFKETLGSRLVFGVQKKVKD